MRRPVIHHVALSTGNLEAMKAFYVEALGFELVTERQWADDPQKDAVLGLRGSVGRLAIVKAQNCAVELFEFQQPEPTSRVPLEACDRYRGRV